MLAFRPHRNVWQRIGVLSVATLWLICGLLGLGLSALWLATDHSAAWANHNLLLANPLCLLMLAAIPALVRGRAPAAWLRHAVFAIAILAMLALLKTWLMPRGQQQMEWIFLLLPAHLLLAWKVGRLESAPSAQ